MLGEEKMRAAQECGAKGTMSRETKKKTSVGKKRKVPLWADSEVTMARKSRGPPRARKRILLKEKRKGLFVRN